PGARGLAEGLMRDLRSTAVWRSAAVWGLFGRTLAVLQGGRIRTVSADAVILAIGAMECLDPFPGWDLEGVMGLEAAWEAGRAGRSGRESGPAVAVGGSEAGTLATRLSERGVAVTLIAPERPKGVPDRITVISGVLAAAAGSAQANGGHVERAI